ncbi:hypothetical protein RB195_009628 [Necator americanus]|uniref:Uncharacterized protein n=1 Tax=Necator americanus TaxID=51031 RepID=A0ABR1CVF1_NECAM
MQNEFLSTCVHSCWSTDRDANSFTTCIQDIAKETFPLLMQRKKFPFASVETRSMYNSEPNARSTGDFSQERRLRRKPPRKLQQDRENEWISRTKEFENARESKNPRKAYELLKQYSGKMKRYSTVLNTAVTEYLLLTFLDFEVAFDSQRFSVCLLNALSTDRVPGKFVRLIDDLNQRATAAVRTPVGCTMPFDVELEKDKRQ